MQSQFDINGITTRWKVSYVIGCMSTFCLFALLSQPGRGVIAGFSFASIVLAARVRWQLRRFYWFWLFLLIAVLLHIAVLEIFNPTFGAQPTIIFAPFAIADFAILMICLFWIEKAMKTDV